MKYWVRKDITYSKKIKMKEEQIQKSKENERYISLVRIMQTDIPGNKRLLVGLTYIKGISWAISNALCRVLGLDLNKKIADLDKKEIDKLSEYLNTPKFDIPKFLLKDRKSVV